MQIKTRVKDKQSGRVFKFVMHMQFWWLSSFPLQNIICYITFYGDGDQAKEQLPVNIWVSVSYNIKNCGNSY